MRTHLCIEEKCMELIEYYNVFIEENKEKNKRLKKEEQEHPNEMKNRIEGPYETNFMYRLDIIKSKYSIGQSISTIETDFKNSIEDMENMKTLKIGYLRLL